MITRRDVESVLGKECFVDEIDGYIRIQTHLTYTDGDCIDVFINKNSDSLYVIDLGESRRIANNRFAGAMDKFSRPDFTNIALDILGVGYPAGCVTKGVSLWADLKKCVISVAVACSIIERGY